MSVDQCWQNGECAATLNAENVQRIAELEQARDHWQAKYQAEFDDRCKAEDQLANLRGIGKRLLAEHKNSNVDWQAFRELEQALQGGSKDE